MTEPSDLGEQYPRKTPIFLKGNISCTVSRLHFVHDSVGYNIRLFILSIDSEALSIRYSKILCQRQPRSLILWLRSSNHSANGLYLHKHMHRSLGITVRIVQVEAFLRPRAE